MIDKSNFQAAKILWTGGWDSTFQLLRLLFLEKRQVEPYYLIDEGRASTGTELLTMKRIRQRIREVNASADQLIHPTKYFSVSQVPSHSEITHAYREIKNVSFIGSQYDWLARFCEYQGIGGLQLCIHEDDKAAIVVGPMVDRPEQIGAPIKIGDKFSETNEYVLFKYFDFPIIALTRTDMAQIAKDCDWSQIMEMTWFCHSPRNGRPCGRCSPCKYTIEEGLAWRIPIHRRFAYEVYLSLPAPAKWLADKGLGLRRRKSSHTQ